MSGSRGHITRQLIQRLDSLRRAGLDRVPRMRSGMPVSLAEDPARAVAEQEAPRMLFEGAERAGRVALPAAERGDALALIEAEVRGCVRCAALAETRTRTVFGEGNSSARLMFIGEAPGADEDRTGRPFVGRAGKLLDDMITKGMGLRREDVFIANILKCRPPENRVPLADEVANCRGYLDRQIEVIRPEYLCLLGKTAAGTLLDTAQPMKALRGRWFEYQGVKTLVTYHPAYLLRNPASKREAWEDLKRLMDAMGLAVPKRG